MDAMCNEHKIYIPFVPLVVDSDLKDFLLQLGRQPGGNSHIQVGSGLLFGGLLDRISISDLQKAKYLTSKEILGWANEVKFACQWVP
jgi:hypothetical protein